MRDKPRDIPPALLKADGSIKLPEEAFASWIPEDEAEEIAQVHTDSLLWALGVIDEDLRRTSIKLLAIGIRTYGGLQKIEHSQPRTREG